MLLYFFHFLNNKKKVLHPPLPPKIHIYQYILDIKHYFQQISWSLSRVPLETPETMWNNLISPWFISLLADVIPFRKALSHNYVDDPLISNAYHADNFHHRDLEFSDIVPNTITIFKHNKKKDKNLITTNAVPLTHYKQWLYEICSVEIWWLL